MVAIRIDVKADNTLRDLKAVRQRMKRPDAPLKIAARDIEAQILRQSFRRERAPSGQRWPKLKPATIKRKGSDKILMDRGLLRGGVTAKVVKGVLNIGVSGPAARYASVHQFSSPKQGIPRRAFLPLTLEGKGDFRRGWPRKWRARTVKLLERYIATGKLRR